MTHKPTILITLTLLLAFTAIVQAQPASPALSTQHSALSTCPAWQDEQPSSQARSYGAAVAAGGKLYYFGGRNGGALGTAEVFDPAAGSWTGLAAMPHPRSEMVAGESGGNIYVVGGRDSSVTDTLSIYNIAAGTWTNGPPLPQGTAAAGGAMLSGRLYVFGGNHDNNQNGSTNSYYYDTANNTWTSGALLPYAVSFVATAELNGILYLTGGVSYAGLLNQVYSYNPANNVWTQRANLPIAAKAGAMSAYNGKLLFSGGQSGAGSATTYLYDPGTNTWSSGPALASDRYGHAQANIGDRSVLVGGFVGGSTSASTVSLAYACASTPTPALPTPTRLLISPTPRPTATPCNSSNFPDVPPNSWAYSYVTSLTCLGAISGYPDGLFHPAANLSRDQMAKVIVAAKGWPIQHLDRIFSDVDSNYWAYDFIQTSYAYDAVTGYRDTQDSHPCSSRGLASPCYLPHNPITRAETVSVIVRMQGWAPYLPETPTFHDVPGNYWAYPFIETGHLHGIADGYAGGYFRPNANVRRDELCKLLTTALGN